MQPPQPAPQLLAHLGVERAERLVEQQHLRLDRERPREGDALALAARQLRGVAVGQPVELDELQELRHARADLVLGEAPRARPHAQAEGDVLEHRHVAEERVVLEHEADAALSHVAHGRVLAREQHLAAVGPLEPGDDPQQARLARARGAEERHQLARRDVQAHVVHRDEGAERLRHAAHLNRHGTPPPAAGPWRRATPPPS